MTRASQPRPSTRQRSTPMTLVSHAKTAMEEPETAAATEEDVPAGPAPADALSEMMSGLQGAANSRISIYRIVKNQPPSYVAECAPESFSLDDLRDKYRGGEFRLYIMKDGRLWKNMRIFVEAPVVQPSESIHQPQSHLSELLAVMRDGFAAQAAALREAAPRSGAVSSLLDGQNLPAVITAITGAIVALRPPAPPAPPPQQDNTSTALDMFMEGLRMARELREEGGAAPADNSIGGMLREVLRSPLMAQAVQAATIKPVVPTPPATARLPPPQPQASAEATQPTQQPPSAESSMSMLTHYYAMLCQKAAAGADPTLYAELVLDNVDDETLNGLLTKQPTPLDALIAEYPPAAAHREWFASLIDTLMSAMTEESEPSSDQASAINGASSDAAHQQPAVVPGQPS